ncbi:MAG TPA: hypothetical protein VFE47_04430 [Tepidisphaeraceae bacterium]|jgi:hypothetical protein|nr:hypothetical protein [Tepidisphaeraceae bacterium]
MSSSTIHSSYRVWRVGQAQPALLGSVDAAGYIEAVHAAEHRYGADIQVYLPPAGSASRAITSHDGIQIVPAGEKQL